VVVQEEATNTRTKVLLHKERWCRRKGLVYESGFELTCMRNFVEKRDSLRLQIGKHH